MAYRRTPQVEARLADNRERILSAARRIVADGGFRDAQVAAVAAAAGVATGTVYRYFPSKADLLVSLLQRVCAREVAVVREICRGDGPAAERLADAVRTFALRALRGQRLAYAIVAEPVAPEVEDARMDIREELALEIAGLIRECVADGAAESGNPVLAGACVIGALLEGLVGPLAQAEAGDPDAVAAEITHFCLNAIQARSAGPANAQGELHVLRRDAS